MASNSTEVVDANSTPTFFHTDPEKGSTAHLSGGRPIERVITPGGHPIDFSQPAIPVQHRKFGNPLPAALISFSTGFFFLGLLNIGIRRVLNVLRTGGWGTDPDALRGLGLGRSRRFLGASWRAHTRGIVTPHVIFPVLIMFLGITQTLTGWFEMFIGNTYSATIFVCYGGFIFSYSLIYLPSMGILEAYTDKETGLPRPEFHSAVGIYLGIWAGITFLFIIASLRSSVAILSTLVFTCISFALLAAAEIGGSPSVKTASGATCMIAGLCGYWSAMAGYWTPDITYVQIPPIDLSRSD
ncbi:hypothetical protein A1Q1_05055 [Trichosporon asahii var. asahii CBS 2479]|uniref:Uncharacterized protein n=1 Tax=Trichosporon asahii var. asahii (strain ATCC 90039 / CBS 2479 / JCM 2466 / KCTC 7840 / NBRC 103889/ NCYC 2677 / UAMH 7654) TaxID=1186058 RepID=J5QAX7_TRIAS|nr:hypothetical protein A1Q1_05055 [Trichosporon asahii var. asahii CBS 2479]EJT46408.1 hypothetical protein A1Q1_05055 [Trichosporon asahii var. asahii CBS 2479]